MCDNIVDISKNKPHEISEVICVKCCYRWISVRPVGTLLKNLECPICAKSGSVINTGQDLEALDY